MVDFIKKSSITKKLRLIAVLVFGCLFSIYFLASCTGSSSVNSVNNEVNKAAIPDIVPDEMKNVDFSSFKHNEGRHKTLPCLLCHQPTENSTKPRFSTHAPCAGCHTEQFKDKTHPICVICHTKSDSAELKPFPILTSFTVQFDHAAHLKLTNCATCHKTNGNGMSIPAGENAHTACYQCHTTETTVNDKNMGSCSTCHQPGTPNRINDAKTINVGFNFDHAKHASQNCQNCHSPAGENKMSAITVGMHNGQVNSCATCHNGTKTFGAKKLNDCKQCHTEVGGASSFGVKFNHADHLAKTNCATCHKSGGSGSSFSVPNGETAHTTCFQCHSPMKDRATFNTSKCFQCHEPGGGKDIIPATQSTIGNFSHTKHKTFSCKECHNPAGGKMSEPTVAMHKAPKTGLNCASCHNNQKAFGEDFTNCKRCHTDGKFKF